MEWIYTLMIVSAAGILGYTYRNYIQMGWKLLQLSHQIIKGQDLKSFELIHGQKLARINYCVSGLSYQIIVPYDPEKIVSMSSLEVFLMKDNKAEKITQQPGIPYVLSAKQLGGSLIVVTNEESEYSEYIEAPQYC